MKHRFEKFANKYSKTTNLLLSIFVYTIVTFGLLPLNDAIATVYVSTITAKYIVIAIDSREVFTRKANENVCKLAILPKDMIYFGDGIVNADMSDIKFNIRSVVYDVVTADTSNDIEKIRNIFTQKIATIYERLFHLHETEAVSATAQGMVQHGFFAGLNSAGIPIVAADEITYHRARTPKIATELLTYQMDGDKTRDLVAAHTEITAEFGDKISKRAQELLNRFGYVSGRTSVENYAIRVKAIATAVRDWSGDNKIGGDIAVITIEKGKKWSWFNRPAFCPELR